jgi:two-component system, chemotaxis family, sensor kinase Cph1
MASLDFVTQIKQYIAEITNLDQALSDTSLINCDREPIHLPNAIQPHGVLLAIAPGDFVILQVSQNVETLLGYPTQSLLGQPLKTLLSSAQIQTLQNCLNGDFEAINPLHFSISVNGNPEAFEGIVHLSDGVIVLELEPLPKQESVSFFDFYRSVKVPISRFQSSQTLSELSQRAVSEIRRITGFDRVMLYRFDQDGSGSVIAEATLEGLEPYLGLRYPATDIPKQAKALYQLNLLRIIPDFSYRPVPLIPAQNPLTGSSLDLSLSTLRSVSPMHTEYLANMGVCASMSISLLHDHQLWGLIACHHALPRLLSYETRTICEFLGQVISSELHSKAEAENLDYRIKLQKLLAQFTEALAQCENLAEGLHRNQTDLMDLVSAKGFAFIEGTRATCFGSTPPEESILQLVEWISQQIGDSEVYATDALGREYPNFAEYGASASGILVLKISRMQQIYMLWFRPEVIQSIHWGGEPNKPAQLDEDGSLRLSPRQSFKLWKETVRLKSLPWQAYEINISLELRSIIIGIVLQKADELSLINSELERSNAELDSFAYVASHDLKEPLRAIHNYSTFLMEDYGEQLGEDGNQKLNTLMRLTQRMEDLINSLLHYSRLGRSELRLQAINLNTLIEGVIEVVTISKPGQISFEIPRPLPILQGDYTQINELFTNLVSNAIKYNDKAQKLVEIGYILPRESGTEVPEIFNREKPIYFVRDNGIGIREKHYENIFKIFKRLHPANRYGGGTGAGLTIVKKIVERHHGVIAIQSVVGAGSTFFFTLE